jgi:WD40 repeat protein
MDSVQKGGFEFLSENVVLHNESSEVYCVASNEHLNLLALGLVKNSVVILHLDSFEEYFRDTNSHDSYVWSLQFSQDGNYLFSGDNSGNIIQWNVKTKKLIKKFNPHTHNVRHFRIYGNDLISCSIDGDIVFTDIFTLEEQKRHKSCDNTKLLLDEFKHELMTALYNGNVEVLNLKTKETFNITIETSAVWALLHFQENDSYFFGMENGTIVEWKNGKIINNAKVGKNRISEIILYQGRLIVVSFDQHLRILDPFTLQVLFEKKIDGCRFTWILNVKNQYFITCGVSGEFFHVWYLEKSILNVLKVLKRKRDLNICFCFE